MRFIKLMHFETVSMSDNSCARGLSYSRFLSHIRPFFGNNLGFSGKKSLKLWRFLNFVNLQNSKIFIGFFLFLKPYWPFFVNFWGSLIRCHLQLLFVISLGVFGKIISQTFKINVSCCFTLLWILADFLQKFISS